MNERYLTWYTPYLSRKFEMLAFGDGGGLPLIIFPTSFGRYYQTRHESCRMSEILNSKGIKHWLDDGKWRGHDWNYWRDMLPHYLSTL